MASLGIVVSAEAIEEYRLLQEKWLRRYDRYRARINRPRCPRSPRWRRGTRYTDYGTTWSDLFAGRHNDMGGHISIYDGGTNHQVPSGPRRVGPVERAGQP